MVEIGCGHPVTAGEEVWYGCPGHFIGASRCVFHLHTHVGKWCVSSVGDYRVDGKQETLGAPRDSFYETMVFDQTDEENRYLPDETKRYATENEAQAGHCQVLKKYAA